MSSGLTRAGQAVGRLARALRNAPGVRRAVRARFGTVGPTAALRRVAVFPGLGLAYNRIKKNANTSVLLLLRELETGTSEARAEAKWNVPTLLDMAPADQHQIAGLSFFVVIRNPYSRVLSAFLDKFRHAKYQRKHGRFALTPAGFAQFVAWLDTGGLARDAHWDLQEKLIAVPLGQFDRVIRFETFREDMIAFLDAQGITAPDGSLQTLFPADQGKQTDADKKLQTYYTPDTAARVARLYARDFATLGYSTIFPSPP